MRGERRRAARATGSLPRPSRTRNGTRTLLICAALVIAVAALYAQTARFEFVSLDDYNVLVDRPIVRAGLSRDGLWWAASTVEPNWHPVTWLSHMLDFTLFGADAGPQHLVNAALHAANSVLLLLALRALSGALWPSALVAALFALHPMRAESVAWVTERKDVLSGLFWMLTMLAYARYARRPTTGGYAVVATAFVFGLMSKTMLVSLPVILLLLDVWPLRRWQSGEAIAGARSLAGLALEKLPLVALAIAASALTVFTLQRVSGVRSLDQISMAWRLLNAPIAYIAYLRDTVWPTSLAAIYPHPALLAGAQTDALIAPALGAMVALLAITALCLLSLRSRPYLLVGWLWYVISLVPVIGVLQVGMQSRADRFSYLPTIGVYIMLAWGLRDVVVRWPRLRVAVTTATGLALLGLAVTSGFQIATWRNSTALYEHAIAVTRDNYLAYAYLGAVRRGAGQTAEAEVALREALRLRPNEPFTRMQLGTLLQDEGRLDEAAAEQEEAVRLDPSYAQAYGNLGVVRLRQGRLDEAEAALRAAVRLNPGYTLAYSNLGAALLRQERWPEAATVLQQAVALDPNAADAHNNLGVALVRLGDLHAAEAQFTLALRLNPNHANAAKSLAYVRSQLQ